MLNINTIMVPLDLHEVVDCTRLIDASVELAEKFTASLTFVNVVDVDLGSAMVDRFKDIKADYVAMARKQLDQMIVGKIPDGIDAQTRVMSGRSYATIVDAANEIRADLIIVAAHKSGMKEFLLGMTAARVVRHANCSVLVVRTDL